MKFTKMQGLGNDYIYVNCFKEEVIDPSGTAKIVSDRHFGIGGDGLVLIMPSEQCDFRMRMFNADGSEAEMCGNAIRCVGKYIYEHGMSDKQILRIETLAGEKVLNLEILTGSVEKVRVDMGEPILIPREIPVNSDKHYFVKEPVEIVGKTYNVTCVSMGNPHAVTYVEDVNAFDLHAIGPKMENHSLFPRKINAEFVQVVDRNTLKMRVWERGAGETLACGTGACAVLVSSVINRVSDRRATVELLGGDLFIEWDEFNNHVYMTGPAVEVFSGDIQIPIPKI